MKTIMTVLFAVVLSTSAYAAGLKVDYQVNNQAYEGYYVSNNKGAPLVLLPICNCSLNQCLRCWP